MKLSKLETNELVQLIQNAPKEAKGQVIIESVQKLLDDKLESIVNEYQSMAKEVSANNQLFDKYGLRNLSAEEHGFYELITDPMQASHGFTKGKQEDLIPTSITNYVFEDLKQSRPLFQYIDWSPAGVKKWILAEKVGKAAWGALDETITKEITAQLEIIDFEIHKLAAFAIIPLGIIELGHEWVDKYVREVLLEVNEEGLEEGIIAGNGKNAPVGMIKNLKGNVQSGVYPDADAVEIKSFTAEALAPHLATLSDGGKRTLSKLVLIVNPSDYFTKVLPATTYLSAIGEYRQVLPFNIEIVQATSVPQNKAILYVPMGYSAGISRMGLYESDEFKFLDHVRAFKVVTYGNGRLKKQNMTVLLNITKLAPLAFNVKDLGVGA
ncbi:phage major capsid protein [Erysipelothrix rhusiopathiae]|nr:phage major capsid protein [Erysipelothrix rhusiopathiae]